MSKSEPTARSLSRDLKREQDAHKRTRRELQEEIERVWRLVPSHYINLMGVYPPLRKLLHVLAEAADLQDPSRGAPVEDTMRTQFVHTGERASTSMTESASQHGYYRQRVRDFSKDLRIVADAIRSDIDTKLGDLASRAGGSLGLSEWEYELPDRPVCWRKGCAKRGVKQPYSAWSNGCTGCNREFENERVG